MLALEDLPVVLRLKVSIRQRVFGMDDIAIIIDGRWLTDEVGCITDVRMNVQQITYRLTDGFVEIDQKVVLLLVEGTDIVCKILEEGTLAIGALQGIPMDAAPLVVVADAQVLNIGTIS